MTLGTLLKTSLLAAFIILMTACSSTEFGDKSASGSSTIAPKGNGDNYSGKAYILELDRVTCADGKRAVSVIVSLQGRYLLTRDNCRDLNPSIEIPSWEIDDNQVFLVYNNQVYAQEYQQPLPQPPQTEKEPQPLQQPQPPPQDPKEEPVPAPQSNCADGSQAGIISFNSATGTYYADNGAFSINEYGMTGMPSYKPASLGAEGLSFMNVAYVTHAAERINAVSDVSFATLAASVVDRIKDVSHLSFTSLNGNGNAAIGAIRDVSHATLWGSVAVGEIECVSHLYIEKQTMARLVGKRVSVSHIHLR